jgi:hypothetical protein
MQNNQKKAKAYLYFVFFVLLKQLQLIKIVPMTKLSVNNKIATLRNARGGNVPIC